MRAFYRTLRILSAVTLFFFSWTFLPLWQVAAWAAEPPQKTGGKGQGVKSVSRGPATSGERFEKALEAIRENVSRAGEKADKGEDDAKEREIIKTKKAEIESADSEFRKEFSATEKKLKDAKLPKEILDRHYKFVKHYDDNLKELKTNLDDVEKATTKADRKAKITKAKAHLEKTKTPSKHVPLDPNKLPHRMVKGKERAPRLKKEEFEKDFPQRKKPAGLQSAEFGARNVVAAYFGLREKIKQKPILLAYNGPASDVPLDLSSELRTPNYELNAPLPGFAFSDNLSAMSYEPQSVVLAQATVGLPTTDDLAETPEVQFTPEIQAKAAELGHNPVKIYEWVRNNIEFVPTYGSIQGAQMTMETKLGNAFDTASLLIALYRASGIPARYVYGTVEMPIEKAMNWVGGVTDPKMAGTVLATNGIPAKMLISGGTYKAVQLEHVYVSAFIDYIPSRGAVHKQGDTWIPLDPSFKQYTYTQGFDIQGAVPFDAQTFANQLQSTATINPDGSVTNVSSTLVQQTMQDYQTQVQNYIQQYHPNATVGDVIGKKEIVKQEFGILVGTLPYKMIQAGSEFATVPDNLRATMSFGIPDPSGVNNGFSYTATLSEITGKKITLSFSPATAADQAVIDSFLPKPHADGTPIQPSELPASFLAYLINLRPELRIGGQIVASGSTVTMGTDISFTIALNEPGIGPSHIDNMVKAGEYYGIGLDTGGMGDLTALKVKLEETKAKIDAQNLTDVTKDDIVGDLLYTAIAVYFAELDATDEIAARTMNVIRYRASSVGMFSLALNIKETLGVPTSAGPKGMIIDVDRTMQAVFSKDGNMERVKQYMSASGSNSSALEHAVPEKLFSTPSNQVQGISAVKTLKAANDQGIPIYAINQSNINAILPQLQLNGDVKSDIQSAVNAGKIVTVQKTDVTYNGWTGCGYIIIDPNTGAGAYMISGGANGGGFMYVFWSVMWVLAWVAFITALTVLAAVAIAFLPEIIAALGSVYLTASIATAIFIESSPYLNSLFSTINLWAQYSPPPVPAPTTQMQGLLFFIETRILFYYYSYKKYLDSSIMYLYWRFAMNVPILKYKIC